MFSTLLALTLVAGADPQPTPQTPPKVVMPKLTNGPAPSRPAYAPVPRTIQVERAEPSNPFLGKRTADFHTIPGTDSIPVGPDSGPPFPDVVGHVNELMERLYIDTKISRDVSLAKEEQSRRLPVGRFEQRNVWVYDFRSGQSPPDGSWVALMDPNEDNSYMPYFGYRRYLLSPTVTVGRFPYPGEGIGDRFAEARIKRDVEVMRDLSARQAEYNRQKLAYDRIRSRRTSDGPRAATPVHDYVPQAVAPIPTRAAPTRGVRVYKAPIGPMPKPTPSALPSRSAWHPPMSLPQSTPLP
jgi:hypothetical protein